MTSESSDGVKRSFRHPFLQACGMFVGEMMCMIAFYIVRWRRRRRSQSGIEVQDSDDEGPRPFNPFIFLPPALCDMTATSIQYIGLTLTYASSFQMLRGAVIIFTGLLSKIFLRRRLQAFRWVGILFVMAGLAVVGMCDIFYPANDDGGHNQTVTSNEYFGVFNKANEASNHSTNEQLLGKYFFDEK